MPPTVGRGLAVIFTLPGGAADPLSATRWKPGTIVLDVVYAPRPTRLARSARDAGCPVVSGLTVLLYQAVVQVELMTGRTGPVEAMRSALVAAVGEKEEYIARAWRNITPYLPDDCLVPGRAAPARSG